MPAYFPCAEANFYKTRFETRGNRVGESRARAPGARDVIAFRHPVPTWGSVLMQHVFKSFRVAGPLAAVLVSVGLVTAGAQAPAGGGRAGGAVAPAPGQGAPAGGQGRGGGRGRGMAPSALRAVPAETTTARAKDPNWKAPRTAWGHPDIE